MALQKQTHGDRAGDKGTGHSSKVQTGQADSPAVTGLPSVFHVPAHRCLRILALAVLPYFLVILSSLDPIRLLWV